MRLEKGTCLLSEKKLKNYVSHIQIVVNTNTLTSLKDKTKYFMLSVTVFIVKFELLPKLGYLNPSRN